MSNPATQAPPFTRENAREMAFRSTVSRRHNAKREKDAYERGFADALSLKPDTDEARKKMTLRQIDSLDARINNALDEDDESRFLKLSKAKAELWKLVQPTAGVNKPGRSQRRPDPPTPTPSV